MRVLQLIDSLNAGGAECIAVNYANSLINNVEMSCLCATRNEGILKETIEHEVAYIFLNRNSTIDLKAIQKLNRFVRNKKIRIIHAHASSYFIATIVKLLNPEIVLIWHEHYGNRENTSRINKTILKFCSYLFSCIITVNELLQKRSKSKLLAKAVYLLPNYPIFNKKEDLTYKTILKGNKGKRIVCLANLRPDKDHLNLLKAFKTVLIHYKEWSLHLIGKRYNDSYNKAIKSDIIENALLNNVFIYGSCSDVFSVLKQSDIGVLSSKFEGLPIALLEYGLANLPVVATDVGDCRKVISNTSEGFLVESENALDLANGLITLIEDKSIRETVATNLNKKVRTSFSERDSITLLTKIYKQFKK